MRLHQAKGARSQSGGRGGRKQSLSRALVPVAAAVAGDTVFETTRSGRVRLPPLAFWCNQTVVKVWFAGFGPGNR